MPLLSSEVEPGLIQSETIYILTPLIHAFNVYDINSECVPYCIYMLRCSIQIGRFIDDKPSCVPIIRVAIHGNETVHRLTNNTRVLKVSPAISISKASLDLLC